MSKAQELAKQRFEELDRQKSNPTVKVPVVDQEANKKEQLKKAEADVAKQLGGATTILAALNFLHDIAVVKGQEDYRGRISEQIFVAYFLPYFRQVIHSPEEITTEVKEYREKVLTDWISVAGSAFNEVVVLDNAGKTLFIVPGLNSTRVINPVRKDGAPSFETIANMAERLQLVSPTKSQEYQNQRLHDKIKDMADGKHRFRENEQIWLDIFARYPDENVKAKEQRKPSGNSGKLTDDDIIYD